jgi:DNA-directed RNA polymerase beta subunit
MGRSGPDAMVGVVVPYARSFVLRNKISDASFKLLLQEMAAMGIDIQIATGHADRPSQ